MSIDVKFNAGAFNAAMANYADALIKPSEASAFVKIQAGRLVQTLIKITPPENPAKTRKRIEANMMTRAQPVIRPDRLSIEAGGKHGKGNIRWYAWGKKALYGVDSKVADLTKYSDGALYQLLMRRTKTGRVNLGTRGKQKVMVWRKTLVKKSTLRKVIARLKKTVGRLKAGWLVSWRKLGSPSGIYSPPKWITDNESKAKGFCIDGLGIPGSPEFSLINQSAGAGHVGMQRLVLRALEIRAAAMIKDMQLKLKYAKQKAGLN